MNYQQKLLEPKRVYLTAEELSVIESAVLSNERLEKVRDVFVFACYTGLAYADVSKLDRHHFHEINNKTWILLSRTKTKNQSTIPLFPQAKTILEKYSSRDDKNLLPVISSQNMNKYLKEVAGAAKIGKSLGFHTARHTFASTVTLNNGVDIVSVSAMLGHKMLRTTQIYARVDMNKIAADVAGLLKKE